MKAILVFDMPDTCEGCPCCYEGYSYCPLLRRELGVWAFHTGKPVDCPLKPIPEKKVVTVERIEDIQSYSITEVADMISAKIILKTDEVFAIGWNTCLDEITGEQNESNISN